MITISNVRVREAGNPNKKTRVEFFIDKETVAENLMNRRHRPYREYKEILPDVLKKAGLDVQKGFWRQRDGCRCGCSPAMVLEKDLGHIVTVTIK